MGVQTAKKSRQNEVRVLFWFVYYDMTSCDIFMKINCSVSIYIIAHLFVVSFTRNKLKKYPEKYYTYAWAQNINNVVKKCLRKNKSENKTELEQNHSIAWRNCQVINNFCYLALRITNYQKYKLYWKLIFLISGFNFNVFSYSDFKFLSPKILD